MARTARYGKEEDLPAVRSFAGFSTAARTQVGSLSNKRQIASLIPTRSNHLWAVEQSFFSPRRSDFASIDGARERRKKKGGRGDASRDDTLDFTGRLKLEELREARRGSNRLFARSMDNFSQGNLQVILEKEQSGNHLKLPDIGAVSIQPTKRNSLTVNLSERHGSETHDSGGQEENVYPGGERRPRRMRKSLDMMDGKIHMSRAPKRYSLDQESLHRSRERIYESSSLNSFTSSRSRFSDSDSSRRSLQNIENKPKVNYGAKFRRLSKFLVVLFGLWKDHARRVKEFMDTNVDLLDVDNPIDLMFDASEFSRDKQATLSAEIKTILVKRPSDRTKEELKKVRVSLGNYHEIAEYPLHMKKLMAKRAWCETYDAKKVIVRQGHPSRYYYIVLSGSVIVTKQEEGTEISKTDCFLERGDSFGELGLINNAPRRATVISKDKVELLVFNDEDYVDIFMSGGLTDENDPFLSSLTFLKGWPLEKLVNNPNFAYISYFKRGTPLVLNSSYLDWLVIVKSGSCKVLKKLEKVRLSSEMYQRGEDTNLRQVLDDHETVVNEHFVLAEVRAETRSISFRKRMLNDLELKIELLPITDRALETSFVLDEISDANEPGNINGTVGQEEHAKLESGQGKNVEGLQRAIQKEPFITKTAALKNTTERGGSNMDKEKSTLSTREGSKVSWAETNPAKKFNNKFLKLSTSVKHAVKAVAKKKRKKVYKEKKHTIVDDLNHRYLNMYRPVTSTVRNPVFVRLQTLTPGAVFGLNEILHEEQPTLSLVSNGSECIIISKKLYEEHVSKDYLRELKNETSPYPPDSYFQDSLQVYIDWEVTCRDAYTTSLFQKRMEKTDPNDSRSVSKVKHAIGMET